ncbi:hypothetical protein HYC85_011362 [Camellia sinensis]|uniref:Uncharacterized protein n=1 Tax=Camellia sinensis TaxID=4442 RepID=A0A7J7H946_CAMSI|nr:hypothetical protein HYC85_011362 [Camellia sinensis]
MIKTKIIDYMQRQLELEFKHDDFYIEESYCDFPEAYNAMVGSNIYHGSSLEQDLGKTTILEPTGDIETTTKGSTTTTNVQAINETKGYDQVQMTCVEGLVGAMDSSDQIEA